MNLRNTRNGYGLIARALHLIMAAMILGQLAVGFWMTGLPSDLKAAIYANHKLGGLVLLFLVMPRLAWRIANDLPDLPEGTPSWQIFSARSLHRTFYLFMIAMPISGWIMSTVAGFLPTWGGYQLAFPGVSDSVCMGSYCLESKQLGALSHDTHFYLGIMFVLGLAVHISIAVWHAYLRDGVFERIFVDKT